MIETASWGRRLVALVVDWAASMFVVVLFLGVDGWSEDPFAGFWTTGVFLLEATLLTALAGGSFGKLVTGLRVVRADGAGPPLDLVGALLRTVLVCLVIPPLVFRPDGRGLHDIAVGSATATLDTVQAAGRHG